MVSKAPPLHFCARPDGTLTPMVALDEFPSSVSIRGVARYLTPGDTQGMTSCGVASIRAEPWVVDGVTSLGPAEPSTTATTKEVRDSLTELHDILLKIVSDNSVSSDHRSAVQGILMRGLDKICDSTNVSNDALVSTADANGAKGTHRKEFCSYWIRHGECDYSQQGCLFKHEMPTDISMLDKLGLRDIPRWYREKYQVESLLHPSGQTNRAQPANAAQKAITYPSNTQQSNTQQSNQPTPPPPTAPDNHGPANNTSNNIARGPNNRYKAQRGPGFAGPKARGNTHWYGKNGQRINLNSASRVANNAPVRGSDSPVSESSKSFADNRSTSSKLEQVTEDPKAATTAPFVSSPLTTVPPSAWIPRQGFGANDIVPRRSTSVQRDGALRHADPFMNVNDVFSQRGGPQGIIGRRRSEELSARQTHLDNGLLDDGHGVPLNSGNSDLFNIKSRHFYSFGCDGDSQNASTTGIATGDLLDTTTEMTNVSTTDTYVPQKSLGQLIQNSEPILPSDLLLNFGPVGEHVQIPPFHQCTKTGALLGPATDYVPRP